MKTDITFSDAKTVELWLPKAVVVAVGKSGLKAFTCIHIVTDRNKQTYYVAGELAYVMELSTPKDSSNAEQ